MKRLFYLLIFLLLFSLEVKGQTFNYLGLEQGLSNNSVNIVFKDSYGFMWFGTFDGLNRFDGYGFKTFRNKIGDPTSLPNKEVYAIAEDRHKNLWIGTSKGAGILNNKNFHFEPIKYRHSFKQGSAVVSTDQRVNEIKFDRQGDAYICSFNTGILQLKKGEATAVQLSLIGYKNYTAGAIAFDHQNVAWAVIDDIGLCRYDIKHQCLSIVVNSKWHANSVVVDERNNLWIGTNNGLYQFNTKTKLLKSYHFKEDNLQNVRIYRLRFDEKQRLWIATDGEGLVAADVLNDGAVKILKHGAAGSLSCNSVHDIYFDEEDRKWIGTIGGGVNTIDQRKNQFTTLSHEPNVKNSLVENAIYTICEDDEKKLWIGSEGTGISVWDRRSNLMTNYVNSPANPFSLSNNRVTSIIMDAERRIWIGTHGGGVCKFDKATGRFLKIPFLQKDDGLKYISKLFLDNKNTIWATCIKGRFAGALKKGLYRFDPHLNAFREAQFSVDQELFSISQDQDGHLLLGGLDKFFKIDLRSGRTISYQIGSIIRAIYASTSGVVWIGTYDRGLLKYDNRSNQFWSYTENDGLCNNTVINIEEDRQKNIWVSTYYGLSRFNPNRRSFDNFYAADGLQSNQFFYNAAARLSTGELAFGGIKGLSYFQPDHIIKYDSFPNLVITGIRLSNDAVNAESPFFVNAHSIYDVKKIRLPYDKAILSLDYVALEYSQPEKIKYAYFLEGWDKRWNYVDNIRNINYSKLNEGHYRLRIKSTNSSGTWNSQIKLIDIDVLPPWYRSWYAYLLYLTSICGAVYIYVIYHRRQARLAYEIKLANLKTAQEKELNEKKIAFFTNISHELRAPLTLIVNPIKELLNNNGKNSELIDLSSVYRNTRRLLSLVDQLLLFRKTEEEISDLKPDYHNLKDICQEVFLCFNNQVKAKRIRYVFQCQEIASCIFADREKIEIVLFNLLSNAVKYTPADGEITMSLRSENGMAHISVEDNGPGIPAEAHRNLFDKFYRVHNKREIAQPGFGIGLFLAKKLVEVHGGIISFESSLNDGTKFLVNLPEKQRPAGLVHITGDSVEGSEVIFAELYPDLLLDDHSRNDPGHDLESGLIGNMITDKSVVLLIDDDAELRRYVKKLLTPTYQVYEATDAEEGLKRVMETEPDIIICDVVMQGLSGVEFCIKIKEDQSLSHIPIILLTSSSSAEIKLKGLECGADDYVTKPFESDLLLARIKGILKGRKTLKTYFLNEITLKSNTIKVPEEYRLFLSKCIEIVERHLDDEHFNIALFAADAGMSRSNLFKKIKSISGLSINEFIRFIRLRKAAELMVKTDLQIKEIAFKVGFQQMGYFRKQFSKVFEVTPSEFIAKHRSAFAVHHKVRN